MQISASGTDMSRFCVDVLKSVRSIAQIKSDWDRLSADSPSPNVFMTYGWFQAWCSSRILEDGPGSFEPFVLVIREREGVVGIAPLIRRKIVRFGVVLRKLEFITIHSDYNDLVLSDGTVDLAACLVEALTRRAADWDLVELADLRIAVEEHDRIEIAFAHSSLNHRCTDEPETCPFMPIASTWEAMMSQRSRSTRRMFRRYEELRPDGLKARLTDRPGSESNLLQKMIEVESQKLYDGERSIPFLGKYREVFQSLFDELGSRDWITVSLLELDSRLIAWQLLFRCGKKIWGYQTAYLHEFSDFSPGTLLIPVVVDFAHEKGFDEFDFLRGDEPYKMRWTSGVHRSRHLIIWNRRLKSRIAAAAFLRSYRRQKIGIAGGSAESES